MSEQGEFFSKKHNQLLNIATWAKYLAWIVLVINMFYALGVYFQQQAQFSSFGGASGQFGMLVRSNFSFAVSLGVEIVAVLFQGIVYFLLLKSISLGLNMIVETDINYRDNTEQGGIQ